MTELFVKGKRVSWHHDEEADKKSKVVTYKTWEETQEMIKNLIANSRLPTLLSNPSAQLSLQQFVPSTKHRFYQEICGAKVPKSHHSEPDLLMHGLPLKISEKELTQAEEGIVDLENDDENPLREPTKQVLHLGHQMTQQKSQFNSMVLLGVSGCSKTRTIYEVFSKRIGLYFTATVCGNAGSHDVEWVTAFLEEKINLESDQSARDAIGLQCVTVLLLGRLIVLDYILSILDPKDEMLPYWWLLLQTKTSANYGQDLFIFVIEKLMMTDPQYLLERLKQYISRIYIK